METSAFFEARLKSVVIPFNIDLYFFFQSVPDPHMHGRADFSIQKDSFVLSHVITVLYISLSFSASLAAWHFTKCSHSTPISTFVPITSGVKNPCSVSITHCKYDHFFSFSFFVKMTLVCRLWLLAEFTCWSYLGGFPLVPRSEGFSSVG